MYLTKIVMVKYYINDDEWVFLQSKRKEYTELIKQLYKKILIIIGKKQIS
jgi:hypothetical protein